MARRLILATALAAAALPLAARAEPGAGGWGATTASGASGVQPSWSGQATTLTPPTVPAACLLKPATDLRLIYLGGQCLGGFAIGPGRASGSSAGGAEQITMAAADAAPLANWKGGGGFAMHDWQSSTYCMLTTFAGVRVTGLATSAGNTTISFTYASYNKDHTC